MSISGLYETSGDWLYSIGLPGKSGIGGGIVTVSPGKGAIGAFAPKTRPCRKQREGPARHPLPVEATRARSLRFESCPRPGLNPPDSFIPALTLDRSLPIIPTGLVGYVAAAIDPDTHEQMRSELTGLTAFET